MNRYDIIGDVHGQANALHRLLGKLGYEQKAGSWRHPNGRKAVFLGDFVDIGPRQVDVIATVRRMVDGGDALAVMGNHELNALAWFLPDAQNPGEYLSATLYGALGIEEPPPARSLLSRGRGPSFAASRDYRLVAPIP